MSVKSSTSTVRRLIDRELYGTRSGHGFQSLWHPMVIDKLGVTNTLEGHKGCVNSLKWNRTGTLLASGSDDKTVCLWNLEGERLRTLNTGHTQNIFGVEFLPSSSDHIMVTCAADATVRLHYLEYDDEPPFVWRGEGRVKRLATNYADPHLVWSAAEDGCIRQYDVRSYKCEKLLEHPRGFKSVAICEDKPELLAACSTETAVPIYDRRNISEPIMKVAPADIAFGSKIHYATHVAFDRTGSELIVNLGAGSVYVYDITDQSKNAPTVVDKLNTVLDDRAGPLEPVGAPSASSQEQREKARAFFAEKQFAEAIDVYSASLADCTPETPIVDRSTFYSNRGAAQMARQWQGDFYACVKDCIEALHLCPSNAKALYRLIQALTHLEQWEFAAKAINVFKIRFPNDKSVKNLQDNLKLHDRVVEISLDESGCRDYKERYIGHTNIKTDIKEANFFGGRDGWIAAGSDCGSLVIYERRTGVLKAAFEADEDILNIVQPHPSLPILATSGIEDVIRLWGPLPEGETCPRRFEKPWSKCGHRGYTNFMPDFLFMGGYRLLAESDARPVECITS